MDHQGTLKTLCHLIIAIDCPPIRSLYILVGADDRLPNLAKLREVANEKSQRL
jgi:hypothetical protein